MTLNKLSQKIGILGGGQLGKMLCQAGSKFGLIISVLEKDKSFPAAEVCPDFKCGDITNYEDVFNFGLDKDIITIEIENVNIPALEALEKIGKKVYPQTAALKIIKDKGIQKMFYEGSGFPSSDFTLFKDKNELLESLQRNETVIPFVQKSRNDGYDGKGVKIILTLNDVADLLDEPCLAEEIVDIEKEIAVIVVRNPSGDVRTYPAVEMKFHPTANLVEYLFCPADISEAHENFVSALAIELSEKLNICGLLAVEMFIDKLGKIWINEVAPRPHNSGHHTIEASATSQYEMHLRAILDLPLGCTELIKPAVMVNLLGEVGFSGPVQYEGIEKCLELEGVHTHLYGKKETRPYRKMGHVTILDTKLEKAIQKAILINNIIKVIA